MRSEMPLYVTTMNKSNVHLKDCSVVSSSFPISFLGFISDSIDMTYSCRSRFSFGNVILVPAEHAVKAFGPFPRGHI
jgi:hypothetical protein